MNEVALKKMLGLLEEINKTLWRIEMVITSASLACALKFNVILGGSKHKVVKMFHKITDGDLKIELTPVDANDNPAKVDGLPKWALSEEGYGALEVAEDAMSAVFKPAGKVGSLKIQVVADADMTEGKKEIFGELPLDLLAAEAVKLALKATVVAKETPKEEPATPAAT